MDFFDLRAISDAGAKPSVKTTQKSVLITIPAHLAQGAGLPAGGRVRVQLGQNGKTKVVRISAASDGAWEVTQRRNVSQLFVRQLMPRATVPASAVSFALHEDAIEITLPSPWELADPHVVAKDARKR